MIHGKVKWEWDQDAKEWILSPPVLPCPVTIRRQGPSNPSAAAQSENTLDAWGGPAEIDSGSDLSVVSEEIFQAMPDLVAGEPIRPKTVAGTSSELMPTYLVLIAIPTLGTSPLRVAAGKVQRVLLGRDVLSQTLFILDGARCWTLSRNSFLHAVRCLAFHSWPRPRIRRPVDPPL